MALATDGFNPFKTLSSTYSIWLVALMLYNLPTWMCMKQDSFILSMITPKQKALQNDINVYLQPLIQELLDLWNVRVETYDSYSNKMLECV